MPRSSLPYLVLVSGVLIASTSAIMITGAITLGVPPLTVAAGRLCFAVLILTPIAWIRAGRDIRRLARSDWLWGMGAGICLALHFATWISSLAYTSVASSTALVATNPIFVALISWLLLRERLPLRAWLGVGLTVVGASCMGLSDSGGGNGSNPLLGDGLALLGALGATGYFLMGRKLRERLAILPYIWLVYTTAAVILLIGMQLAGQSLPGLPPLAYLLMLGLAIGPQLLGHTALNWVIKYLSATLVSVALLGEPVSSTLLAILIFRQPIQALQLLGGVMLLIGIAGTMLAERKAPRNQR